jgi:hypothetical protein
MCKVQNNADLFQWENLSWDTRVLNIMQGLQECILHTKCGHTVLYNTDSLTKEKIPF